MSSIRIWSSAITASICSRFRARRGPVESIMEPAVRLRLLRLLTRVRVVSSVAVNFSRFSLRTALTRSSDLAALRIP